MALVVEVRARFMWVPNTSGNTFLAQAQANIPGQGPITQLPYAGSVAQVLELSTAEPVPVQPGSEGSVTLANLNTALTSCVSDLASASGTPLINAATLALIQGWATGGP